MVIFHILQDSCYRRAPKLPTANAVKQHIGIWKQVSNSQSAPQPSTMVTMALDVSTRCGLVRSLVCKQVSAETMAEQTEWA